MTFKLAGTPTFFFRVEVKRPNDSTGRWETLDFQAEFRRRSREHIEDMVRKGLPRDDELLSRELVGWRNVAQPDGTELKASEESRKWMLEHPDEPLNVADAARTALLAENGVQAAIVRAWLEASITGPVKN